MAKEKEKKQNNVGVSQNDIDSLYDTIAKQQQILNSRSNDWKPTAIPLSNRQTPVMPMQITGSLVYDNTPNMYVAPAYGELKDLSIKKDMEGRMNKSAWEKTKENLYNLAPDINDPSFQYVKELMGQSIDNFDAQLKEGVWSEQADISKNFANELMNKKGGKQFLGMKASMEQNRNDVANAVDEYDPKTGTEGIRQDEVNFYMQPKVKPFVFDEQGNIIGGGQLEFPKVYKNRNLPKEIDDMTKDTKYFQDMGTFDANGKKLYLADTGLFGKYLRTDEKYVTQDRIKEIAEAYLLNTGGYEYIKRQGEIKQFNNPLSLDETREKLNALSSLADKKNNPYSALASLSDEELQKQLNSGLGATLQTADLSSSLLSGTMTKNAYTQRDISVIDDTVAQHAQNAYVDSLYKKSGKGEGDDEGGLGKDDIVPYSFMAYSIGTYETFDPTSAVSIQNRKIKIGEETNTLNSQIEAFKKGKAGYENDPNYQSMLQRKADLDAELKLMDNENKQNIKWFGNLIKDATYNGQHKMGVPLYSAYNDYIGQKKFQDGKTKPVSRETWENAIASAILAEADDDPRTTSAQVLEKAGVGTVIDYTGNKYFNDVSKSNFKGAQKVEVTNGSGMGQYMGSYREFNQGDLLSVVNKSATLLKKRNKENGSMNSSQTIMRDTTVFSLEGDVEKRPESKRFTNAEKNVTEFAKHNLETLKVFNPSGNPNNDKSLISAATKELDIKPEEFNKLFNLGKVQLSTTQSFGKDKGSVYVASFNFKNISQKDDPDIYKAQEKLREKLGGNNAYSIRFTLGHNQKAMDDEMQVALKGLLMSNKSAILGMTDSAKERGALSLGNMNGVNEGVDMLHIYDLDGTGRGDRNQYRDLSFSGYDLRITARDLPFSQNKYNKDFNVQVKENGVYKTLAFKDNKPGLYTEEQLKTDKSITRKNFDTDLDVKAYLNLLKLEQESLNFNKGGGGSNERETIEELNLLYKPTNLINQPQKITTIINKYSNNKSPLTAEDYIKVARDTGVPVDLLLAQGMVESNFGTQGRAVRTKNVGNVGNTDSGAAEYKSSWREGLYRQALLLKNEYYVQNQNDVQRMLDTRFKRPKKGGHYASAKDYHIKVSKALEKLVSYDKL